LGIGIAGIHQPFVAVPTATLTGWNLRRPEFTDGDRHSTQLEQLDVEGILAFAERVLPKASELWVHASVDQRQRLQQLFLDRALPPNTNLKMCIELSEFVYEMLIRPGPESVTVSVTVRSERDDQDTTRRPLVIIRYLAANVEFARKINKERPSRWRFSGQRQPEERLPTRAPSVRHQSRQKPLFPAENLPITLLSRDVPVRRLSTRSLHNSLHQCETPELDERQSI
jgi:hypothetical protein